MLVSSRVLTLAIKIQLFFDILFYTDDLKLKQLLWLSCNLNYESLFSSKCYTIQCLYYTMIRDWKDFRSRVLDPWGITEVLAN